MLALVAFAVLSAPVQTERIAGFFRTEWECKPWAQTPTCGCGLGLAPRYRLDDAEGHSREVFLDPERIVSAGGPRSLEGKWVIAKCEKPPASRCPILSRFDVIDGGTLRAALNHGKTEVRKGMSARVEKAILANSSAPQAQSHVSGSGSKPYLTILCRTADTTTITPRPASMYTALMGSTYPGLDHYLRDMSYGTWNLVGSRTLDWMNLPKNKADYEWLREVDGRLVWDHKKLLDDIIPILDPTIDFSKFQGINLCMNTPDNSGGLYASGYFMTVDGLNGFMPITELSDSLIQGGWAHEIGHDFGFDHSSGAYNTPYDSMWDDMSGGGHNENAPPFGTMWIGNGYNAYHRRQAGWITRERMQTVLPGEDKTFRLERLTTPTNATDALMAKVYISGAAQHYYTVEARKPVGYDVTVPDAVVIHDVLETRLVKDAYVSVPIADRSSQVVDPDKNGDPNDASAQWTPGETFTDATAGIKIYILSSDTTGFRVRITVSSTQPSPAAIFSGADSGPGTLRDWLYFKNDFPSAAISFRIPKTDPSYDAAKGFFRLRLKTPLPVQTLSGIVIDGASQTSFTGDTNPKGPEIMLDGTEAGDFSCGLTLKGSNQVVRNLAVGNFKTTGVRVDGGTGASIENCYLGLEPDGLTPAPNAWDGVSLVGGAKSVTVGGTNKGNLISGNGSGVTLWDAGTANNAIFGNRIGTDRLGLVAVPNTYSGVAVTKGILNTTIGSKVAGQGNLVSGNKGDGVNVADATGTTIAGNLVGTNATGSGPLGNLGWGVAIGGTATKVTVGGPDPLDRNVLGSNGIGIGAIGTSVTELSVEGNLIGLNASGDAAIPNTYGGIYLLNGPSGSIRRNVVSGNTGTGIILSAARAVMVENNLVGTDATGLLALGNNGQGISVIGGTTLCTIGGASGSENVICGNAGDGIGMGGAGTTGNHLSGNFVGVTRSGSALGNRGSGMWVGSAASNNLLGEPGRPNVIGGNTYAGIVLALAGTSGNRIQSNFIGALPTGNARPNGSEGIVFYGGATGNLVGGTGSGEGNRIANNVYGVTIADDATTGNTIRGNSISDNQRLGIQIWKSDGSYGITPNDIGDGDIGPNDVQNFPTLSKAVRSGTGIDISVTFRGASNATVVLDIYGNDTPDNSGSGEGQTYLGSKTVTTDASGVAVTSISVPSSSARYLSATSTNAAGSTSEFGPGVEINSGLDTITLDPTTVTGGTTVTGTVTLLGVAGPSGQTVNLSSSNPATAPVPISVEVLAGAKSATFSVLTVPVAKTSAAKLSATLDGVVRSAQLTVNPPAIKSLLIDPASAVGETDFTGTVTLTGPAATGGQKINLSLDNTAVASALQAITIPAGSTSGTFTVSTVKVPFDTTVTAQAQANGTSASASFKILQTNTITISVSPTNVVGGRTATATVTLGYAAPAGGQLVTLASDHGEAAVPSSVTVAVGRKIVTFSVVTTPVPAGVTARLSASANGKISRASLTVRPPSLLSVKVVPGSTYGGGNLTGTVTLDGDAPSAGVIVNLSVDQSLVAKPPATATVPAGARSVSFTIATNPVAENERVTLTAVSGAKSETATFAVLTPVPTSLAFNPSTLTGGGATSGTITLSGPAPKGGLSVGLSSSQSSAVPPKVVVVAEGQFTATFTMPTKPVTADVVATITALASGRRVAAKVTITR